MDPEKRPSLLKRAKNLTKEAINAAKHLKSGGELLVSEEEHSDRVEICKDCPLYGKFVEDECGSCGCPISTRKAWLASTCCPLYKWDGDLSKTELCQEEE